MFIQRQFNRFRILYDEYPRQFRILMFGVFIDRLGGALLFPFFTLYITWRFHVGMTTVGLLFVMFSASSLIANMLGGALADHVGRKSMVIFGLASSALASVVMGLVDSIELFFAVAFFVGIFADIGGPAAQAMVADMLPEHQRAQGFGIWRVVANLAVAIGPAIGGTLATHSYLLLFICDAVTSVVMAGIIYFMLRETKPMASAEEPQESIFQTFKGYGAVLRDATYIVFLLASMLMVVVYMQMNTTLAVYLRDVHGVPEQGFGYILSLNAAMVVLFQFPLTRRLKDYPPLLLMAVGCLLLAFGFNLYAWVSSYSYFMIAMAVITVGEMVVFPTAQALVAQMAPSDMRGRYMAVFGLSWIIPSATGPLLAGLIMDHADPHLVWHAAGLLGLAATASFFMLHRLAGQRAGQSAAA